MSYESLHEWSESPLGQYLFAKEQEWLDQIVPDIFGYHAIQLGMPQVDLLRESRIVHRLTVDPVARAGVRAQWHELPFDTQSLDLCVLPHVLEFNSNPHEILREIDRVVRPEGRILIIGFNPWSLFGVKKLWNSRGYPWQGQFVSLVRMKDWLQLLGFEPSAGRLACYIPPCESVQWQRRWSFMEGMGNHWWRVGGGVYMLEAIKRVQGMRLMTPAWSDRKVAERKFAAVAKRDRLPGGEPVAGPRPATNLHLVK
jgi:SAM-dependent methyltransferase